MCMYVFVCRFIAAGTCVYPPKNSFDNGAAPEDKIEAENEDKAGNEKQRGIQWGAARDASGRIV